MSRVSLPQLLAIALLILFVGGISMFALAVRTALIAESNLHAMCVAIRACHSFVDQNEGAWPKSWDDIEPLFPKDNTWKVRDRIIIHFDADPAQLAKQEMESFTGIQSVGPTYPCDGEIMSLIEVLKKYHEPKVLLDVDNNHSR